MRASTPEDASLSAENSQKRLGILKDVYDKKIAPAIDIKCAAGGDVSQWKISILSPSQAGAPGEDSWSTEELDRLSRACVKRFKNKGKNVQVIVTQKAAVKKITSEDEAGEFLLEDAPPAIRKNAVHDQVIGTVGSIQQLVQESQATKGTDPESKAIDTDPNMQAISSPSPTPKKYNATMQTAESSAPKKPKPEKDASGSALDILNAFEAGKRSRPKS
jgi:hypothetical protein